MQDAKKQQAHLSRIPEKRDMVEVSTVNTKPVAEDDSIPKTSTYKNLYPGPVSR